MENSEKLYNLSLKSKYLLLIEIFNDLNKFKKLKRIKQETEKKNTIVYDAATELYNDLLGIYFDDFIIY